MALGESSRHFSKSVQEVTVNHHAIWWHAVRRLFKKSMGLSMPRRSYERNVLSAASSFLSSSAVSGASSLASTRAMMSFSISWWPVFSWTSILTWASRERLSFWTGSYRRRDRSLLWYIWYSSNFSGTGSAVHAGSSYNGYLWSNIPDNFKHAKCRAQVDCLPDCLTAVSQQRWCIVKWIVSDSASWKRRWCLHSFA